MEESKHSSMIYGIHAVMETLESGQDLEKVFIQKNLKGDLAKGLLLALQKSNTPLSKVPQEKLNRFTKKNHQGVVAFTSPVKYYELDNLVVSVFERGEVPFFIALDRITDVRNFGAIARSASASGVHGIFIPTKNAAQINSDAMKTSSGALANLPVCRVDNLPECLRYLKSCGCSITSVTEKGNEKLYNKSFTDPVVLVMGSEEDGISDEIIKLSDATTYIPMKGKIGSFNVSAAASICMYEVVRQRN